MSTFCHQPRELFEFREVTLLFTGQKAESVEERDHVLDDCGKVIDFVIPNAVLPLSQCPAVQMSLEQGQNNLVALRHVEAQRHFPRHRVVAALTKRHVETAFTVGEASQVMAGSRLDT